MRAAKPSRAIFQTLRGLAGYQDEGPPVVSLYLDLRKEDPARREAARVFVRARLRELRAARELQGPYEESLETDIRRIRRSVERRLAPGQASGGRGLALFSSAGRGLWLEVEAPRAFDNQLVVRQVPHVLQLARQAGVFHGAVVCQVDSRSARIWEFAFGSPEETSAFDRPEIPGRHAQGGWSQMRYQRHIDWQRERHLREVAEAFVRVADQHPGAQLLLSGPAAALALLRAALPPRAAARSPREITLTQTADLPEVTQVVLQAIEEQADAEDLVKVRRVFEEALGSGLAVTTGASCCQAANAGAIEELLVLERLVTYGWRCRACGLLGSGRPAAACPACSGRLARCDLTARLAEKVLADGGQVHVIARGAPLEQAGGMAARLRFPV